MHRKRTMAGGAALLLTSAVLAQNPVPPQFRGQPTNPPTATQTTVLQQTSNQIPSFKSISPPPANNDAPVPAPVAAPPAPLPGPVMTPPAVMQPAAAAATPAPSVTIEKRCPEMVNAGTNLSYEIIVRNSGTSPVMNVRVEDELPAGAKYVSSDPPCEASKDRLMWSLGNLDAAAERKIKVEVQPSVEGEFRSTALVSFSTSTAMKTQVVRPKLAIQMSAPDRVLTGDAVPFQLQVSNPGTGPVQNLVLRVKLPAGLQHPGGSYIEAELGTLAAGENKQIPLKVTASSGGMQMGEATATGDGGLEASTKAQITVLQPMLQVRRGGPAKVMFKSEVTEEFEISNPGTAPAGNIQINATLPAGLEFVGASDGAMYDPAVRAVTWRFGEQAPGTNRKVMLKAKATAVGDQATHVVASAERGLEAKTDGVVAVEGVPALMLEVADLDDPIEVGSELTYEIRIVNQGSCPCTNIRLVCDVPDGMAAVEATGPTGARVQDRQVIVEPLAKLATKADAVYRIKVRGIQPGDFRFKVQMQCDQLRLPVNKEECSRVFKN